MGIAVVFLYLYSFFSKLNNCTFAMVVEKVVPLEILSHLFRDGWLVMFLEQHMLPNKRTRKQVVLLEGGIFFGIISER